MNIYMVSQNAKEIYLKAKRKKMIDKQRQLMRFVYRNLTLDEGRVNYEYTAFQLLSEAVEFTNRSKMKETTQNQKKIFEPEEKSIVMGQSLSFDAMRPIWLAKWDGFRTENLINAIEYPELLLNESTELLSVYSVE